MPLNPDRILNWPFQPVEHSYTSRDTILYALGIGLGADPLDSEQLRYTFEEAPGFAALPSMAVVLASPGFWARDPETGIDWKQILHGEQSLELHAPVPVAGTLIGQTRVTNIVDKGAAKGALIYSERVLTDKADGKRIATLAQTTFARGDGGCGGQAGPVPPVYALPEREPDVYFDWPTLPQAALIYRLSGDYNPLHAAPDVAAAAGFRAPILHGLCTLGVAGYALLRMCCDNDPARLQRLALRFSSPVYPGETVRTEVWRNTDSDNAETGSETVAFRARVLERDVVVLSNGKAVVGAST